MNTVLIVEDSEPLGRLLATTLARAGFRSLWAATAADALREAEVLAPDAVLVDLHLADLPGTELAASLRHALPAARIIGVSGEAPERAVLDQFDAFLLKPVALDTLVSAITAR